jgi:hypothetical protein
LCASVCHQHTPEHAARQRGRGAREQSTNAPHRRRRCVTAAAAAPPTATRRATAPGSRPAVVATDRKIFAGPPPRDTHPHFNIHTKTQSHTQHTHRRTRCPVAVTTTPATAATPSDQQQQHLLGSRALRQPPFGPLAQHVARVAWAFHQASLRPLVQPRTTVGWSQPNLVKSLGYLYHTYLLESPVRDRVCRARRRACASAPCLAARENVRMLFASAA